MNQLMDGVNRRDDLRDRVIASVTALIRKIENDDKALQHCYQSLLQFSQQKIRQDMDFLRRLLLENGVDPNYTFEETTKEKINFNFKLKKRIRKGLMKEEFIAYFRPM